MTTQSLTGNARVFMVIGDPISHSLSPALHGALYRHLGFPDTILVPARVSASKLREAVHGAQALNIRGIAVTIPHKQSILPHLDKIDPLAAEIGAVNTVVFKDGISTGHNTDAAGITDALAPYLKNAKVRVGIIGAGGAARAALFALRPFASHFSIFARSEAQRTSLASHLTAKETASCHTLSDDEALRLCDILVQATPVGMSPDLSGCPISKSGIAPHHVVFDTVYNPRRTTLLKHAESVGAKTVSGLEMFAAQACAQIQHFLGVAPDRKVTCKLLETILP